MNESTVVAIWLSVLGHLAADGYEGHVGCEGDPPEECTLYETIKDAALAKE